jgi:hypothetical protein
MVTESKPRRPWQNTTGFFGERSGRMFNAEQTVDQVGRVLTLLFDVLPLYLGVLVLIFIG